MTETPEREPRHTDRINAGIPPDRYGWTPRAENPPADLRHKDGNLPPDRDNARDTDWNSVVGRKSRVSNRSKGSNDSVKRRQLEAHARANEEWLRLEKEKIEKLSNLEKEGIERRLAYELSMADVETELEDDDSSQKLSDDDEWDKDLQRRYEHLRFGPKFSSTQNEEKLNSAVNPQGQFHDAHEKEEKPHPLTKTKAIQNSVSDSVTISDLVKALESFRSGPPDQSPLASDGMQKFVARQSTARELPKFSGNVDDWPSFKSQFDRSTNLCKFSEDENLFRLQRSLTGRAKEAVQSMLLVPGNVPAILQVLEKNFGKPEFIVDSLLEKVKNAKSLKEGKWDGIMDLSNLVRNLKDTLEVLKMKGHLCNPYLLKNLTEKLTPPLQLDWGKIRLKTTEENRFSAFSDWLSDIAEAVSPMMKPNVPSDEKKSSKEKFAEKSDKKSKKGEKSDTQKDEVSWHLGKTTEGKTTQNESKKFQCLFCQKLNHQIQNCHQFKRETVNKRWDFVTENKLCFSCLKVGHGTKLCPDKKNCGIDGCTFPHNPLLHKTKVVKSSNSPTKAKSPETEEVEETVQTNSHQFVPNKILSKVVAVVLSGPAGQIQTHAFLDEGSEVTLIDSSIVDQLGLEKKPKPLSIRWSDGTLRSSNDSCSVNLNISGLGYDKAFEIRDARSVKSLLLGHHSYNLKDLTTRWPHLRRVHLVPLKNAKPSILIGSDNALLIAFDKVIKGPQNAPLLGRTPLGWMVTGNATDLYQNFQTRALCSFQSSTEELHQAMTDYFKVESLLVKVCQTKLSKEDLRARTLMDLNTRRVQGGWETGLLWKKDNVHMPPSYDNALKRLYHLEKKMDGDPNFRKQYLNRMQYNFDNDYARSLTPEESKRDNPKTWYLPHFGVYNPQKPEKIRLVLDAAGKSHGTSLNDQLLTGPDLLTSLPGTLIKFRQKEIGFSGDIRDMFHRIKIREDDLTAQRFLWRGERRTGAPDIFVFNVSIFGASCSPFSSQYIKNKNALEFISEFPDAVNAIVDAHYMDNYVDSAHTPEKAAKIIKDVIYIHNQGGFEIWDFSCCSKKVLQEIPEYLRSTEGKDLFSSELKSERVLGLIWDPNTDELTFNLKMPRVDPKILDLTIPPTKRQVLRTVMSVFDPLGFLGNFMIKGKILLQDIWRSALGWDDPLTEILTIKWTNWLKEFSCISELKIPRCFAPDMTKIQNISLHVFCDAGEKAYSTAAYLRIESRDSTTATIVMSKTRVAPLKPLSISRLELQAALMGSRLQEFIKQELDLEISKTYFWTDSSTVLKWIRSDARNYKTFVSHRIGEILEATDQTQWKWVPTRDNVADEATRDNSAVTFSQNSRWLKGPAFLCLPEDCWPKESAHKNKVNEVDLELKSERVFLCQSQATDKLIDFSRYSKWTKLIRVTAWLFRFSKICLDIVRQTKCTFSAELTVPEISKAEKYWFRQIQLDNFSRELTAFEVGSSIPRDSRLKCLTPMIDSDGILRLRGRIDASKLVDDNTKRPIILDNKHPVTKMLILHYHVKAGHHGMERVLNDLRQKFWVLDARSAVKKAFEDCQLCKNRRAKPVVPEMGSLPPSRLLGMNPPFTNSGMDYFGPMYVTIGRRREKRYGVLFTCMTTRAIHLEIAHSLTTDSAIMAIRRMVARRETPARIHSDNGTNLRGADDELRTALLELDQDKLTQEMTTRGIDWKLIPPAAPHMGGELGAACSIREGRPEDDPTRTCTERKDLANFYDGGGKHSQQSPVDTCLH